MKPEEFDDVKKKVSWKYKLTGFINVVYTDRYDFKRCCTNMSATKKLEGFAI